MKRLIIFCTVSILFSFCITAVFFIQINIFNKKIRDLSALHYSIGSKEYNDFIIIGGSNTEGGIDPKIIESITGKTSYALSIKGIGIIEESMLLKKYIQVHPKPKVVFFMLDYETLNTQRIPHNVSDYFSYLTDTFIYRQLSPYRRIYRNKTEQYYLLFQKIFATGDLVKKDIFYFDNKIDSLEIRKTEKGYSPNNFKWLWDADDELNTTKTIRIDSVGLILLDDLITYCTNDSIQFVLFYSPVYFEGKLTFTNLNKFEATIESLAKKKNVRLWNFNQLPLCQSKDYFYNYNHLNLKGAQMFSSKFSTEIIDQIINKKNH